MRMKGEVIEEKGGEIAAVFFFSLFPFSFFFF